jgi:hypothetical protein
MVPSKKQILSALVGVAMLALPVSAFAGHHDNDWHHPQPFARHDHGLHRGWLKHQWARGDWYGTPARRAFVNYGPPRSRPYAWANGYRHECDDNGDRNEWEGNAPPTAYQPYAAPMGYDGGYGYAPTTNYPVPPNPLVNASPYGAGSYYNNGSYTGNPTVDALSAIAIPMLTGVR